MAKLQLTLPEGVSVSQGKQITFKIPNDCIGITAVVIDGINYDLYSTSGNSISPQSLIGGSMMSIIIDTEDNRAILLSGTPAVFIVKISGNETDGYQCDRQLSDIIKAHSENQVVIAKYNNITYILGSCVDTIAEFYKCNISNADHIAIEAITINEIDSVQEIIIKNIDITNYIDNSIASFSVKPYIISETVPENTNLFWIDSSEGNFMKAYDETTSTWVPISAAYG